MLEQDYIMRVITRVTLLIAFPWVSCHRHIVLRVHLYEYCLRAYLKGKSGMGPTSETSSTKPEVTIGRQKGPGSGKGGTLVLHVSAQTPGNGPINSHLSVLRQGVIYSTRGAGGAYST